jgi:hypothetical protein
MVPEAHFTSYYGRPVVKASPWEADIPAYLFLGGLAGGSSLLAAGADLTDRPALRRSSRITALAAITMSFAALVHDLGRPARFHHMLRVAKPSSPMSVGTWLLTAYGPLVGVAAVPELRGLVPGPIRDAALLPTVARGAGVVAAGVAPAVAAYTAVLLSDTATPSWHEARHDLPFVFVGSAAAAAGGAVMLTTPLDQAGPARQLGVAGAMLDLAASRKMEAGMGITAEPMHQGRAGIYLRAAHGLTAVGGLVAATAARRSRTASALAGACLVAGSVCTRFGIFHAGQQSARDPRYTVVPQRERVAGQRAQSVPDDPKEAHGS